MRIVNGDGKHAVEFADKANAVAFIQPQNDFGVRCGFKLHALRPQLISQFNKVEYFTVLHHRYLAVVTDKRLMPAANVNDGQTPVANAHSAPALVPDALIVRPAVHQFLRHPLQVSISKRRTPAAEVAKNAAHQLPPFPLRRASVSHMIFMSSSMLCSLM